MLQIPFWKRFLILSVAFLGVLLALPNFFSEEQLEFLPSWMRQRVVLGLDLQGGSHLLLEVQGDALMEEHYGFILDGLRKHMRSERIGYLNLKSASKGVSFRLRRGEDSSKLQNLLKKIDPELSFSQQDGMVHVAYDAAAEKALLKRAVDKSVETIRFRIDERGTKEPLIQPQGDRRIVLQLPGESDPARVKQLIGKTAKLSFQLVEGVISASQVASTSVPADRELLPESDQGRGRGGSEKVYYLVRKERLVTGDMLVDAQPSIDPERHRPEVQFRFNPQGAKRFGDATRENVGRLFAIVLDQQVISAPEISQPILGGAGVIHGSFSTQEAQDLALLMRSGSLPAPLSFLEERAVGPGLGADSIRAGTIATLVAIVFVALFMLVVYAWFGIFADLALIFNMCLLFAVLSLLGATLTLPGIAGIALTIGMAVDANVLINERIKEELRLGRKLISAIDAGYQRALGTIIDSNVTTLIGAGLLYIFGTGPVRGFAVTLSFGVIISMFTAVSLSRVFVVYWLEWFRPKKLWL
ncbi:MAG: protein translocase subunit SecD [Alphaproteobacteria bacterium]